MPVGKVGYVKNGEILPENAIILSAEKVQQLQQKLISNWEPSKEMLSLKYGDFILGGISSFSGMMIGTYFRNLMKLTKQSKFVLLGPTTFLPFLSTAMAQNLFITGKSLAGENECATCLTARSIFIQLSCGFLQPLAISIIGATVLAKKFSTYPLPPLNEHRTMLKIYQNMVKAMGKQYLVLIGFHVVSAAIMNRKQFTAISKVNDRITHSDSLALPMR